MIHIFLLRIPPLFHEYRAGQLTDFGPYESLVIGEVLESRAE